MKTKNQSKVLHRKSHQRGAALIILMLAIVLSLVTLVTFRSERKGPEVAAEQKTNRVLLEAKMALLGYSASDNDTAPTPGRLSCPDTANAGNTASAASGDCFAPASIPANAGRIPWKLLRVGDPGDGSGERLWYIVAKEFINNGQPLNSTVLNGNLLISLTGSQTMDGVAAVIVAPGVPLQGQARATDENKNTLLNYVEGYVDAKNFNMTLLSSTYNDRIITITAREAFSAATQRVVGELAKTSLAAPYPSSLDMVPPKPLVWDFNNWDDAVTVYSVSTTSAPKDTLKLQFANCASIFTIRWDMPNMRNNVTRSGSC